MWALLAVIRISVNSYVDEAKEAFHPDILIASCLVTACLACYVIEKLRPGFLTLRRFAVFLSPVVIGGFSYLAYRLSGGEIHVFYSIKDVFTHFNLDVFLRLLVLALTLFYMILPIYLVVKYADEYTAYLSENVSDPESYDLLVEANDDHIVNSLFSLCGLIIDRSDNPVCRY